MFLLGRLVFRHADRTPKQKLKFNFPVSEPWTQPFVRLLNSTSYEEIILREAQQLALISAAIREATDIGGASPEDLAKLNLLSSTLGRKISLPGTKAQLKPGFKKGKLKEGEERTLEKLQLVFKWGGEVSRTLYEVAFIESADAMLLDSSDLSSRMPLATSLATLANR